MNILLALILAVLTAGIAGAYLIYRRINQKIAGFKAIFEHDEGKPSEFALITDAVADQIARAIVAQAKATFMGIQSGQVRAEKALEGDIAMDQASQIPLLQGVLGAFPAVKKALRRNPALLDFAIQKIMNKPQVVESSGNGHIESPKFKL